MHTHSREHSPCSKIAAVDLVRAAVDQGLDGLLLTDHHYLWPHAELRALRAAAAVPAAFLLASGQEVTTADAGDVLVYGAPEAIGPWIRLGELRRRCPEAALVLAHPWRGQKRPTMLELFDAHIDAVEVLNRHHAFSRNRQALRAWRELGFVAIGGTDAHDRQVGTYPTVFPEDVTGLDTLVASIKEGTCRPFLKSRRSAEQRS